MDVSARRVDCFNECEKPGDFFFTPTGVDGVQRLSFLCPCGCGSLCAILVKTGTKTAKTWEWDGNEDQPTTKPSIGISRGHWHGYLTAGVFKPC